MRRTSRTAVALIALALAAAWPTPRAGAAPDGQITIAQGADPTTLDPHMHAENFTFAVVHNVFDHLVRRTVKDGQLAHEPGLAAVVDDRQPHHVGVQAAARGQVPQRRGLQRRGRQVQHRARAEPRPEGALALGLRRHRARRDRGPATRCASSPSARSPPWSRISPTPCPSCRPKYVREKGDAYVATDPVGTGPFKFVRWRKDDELVLEANEAYWGGAPKIKTLIWKPIPEESTRVAALVGRPGGRGPRRAAEPGEADRGQPADARGQGALGAQHPHHARHARGRARCATCASGRPSTTASTRTPSSSPSSRATARPWAVRSRR